MELNNYGQNRLLKMEKATTFLSEIATEKMFLFLICNWKQAKKIVQVIFPVKRQLYNYEKYKTHAAPEVIKNNGHALTLYCLNFFLDF